MDQANLERLRWAAPGADAERVRLFRSFDPALAGRSRDDLEVPDPYNGGPDDYALVFDLVQPAVRGLVDQLRRVLDGRPAESGAPGASGASGAHGSPD